MVNAAGSCLCNCFFPDAGSSVGSWAQPLNVCVVQSNLVCFTAFCSVSPHAEVLRAVLSEQENALFLLSEKVN